MRRILLCLGLLFAFGLEAREVQALSLSEIRTEIRRNVRDTSSTSTLQRYSDTVLTSFINEAQKEVNNAAWPIDTRQSVTLVANTTWYDLNDDMLAIRFVFWDDGTQPYELEEKSLKGIYQDNPDWENDQAKPTAYVVRQSTSGADALEIAFWPVAGSGQTGTVYIDYAEQADDLSSDGDVPFNGLVHLVPYHHVLVDRVTARIKFLERLSDEGMAYYQFYRDGLEMMRMRIGEAPNYNPSFGTNVYR